jgi:hypothetical protein
LLSVPCPARSKGKKLTASGVLRQSLSQACALRDAAHRAGEWTAHQRYSKRADDLAAILIQYEQPKLAATLALPTDGSDKTTHVVLKIFEKERKPPALQIEASPIADASPAKTIDADAVVTEPNKEPASVEPNKEAAKSEAKPEPQPPPPAPPPENAYGTSRSGLSLFGPYGHPNFNQHRSIERYRDLYRR